MQLCASLARGHETDHRVTWSQVGFIANLRNERNHTIVEKVRNVPWRKAGFVKQV